MNTIKEKCSCGAEISVESDYASFAQQAISEWREVHVEHGERPSLVVDAPTWTLGSIPCALCNHSFPSIVDLMAHQPVSGGAWG
jgi:hypothetical protein